MTDRSDRRGSDRHGEDDLRAALHLGEGDGPDPDALVSAGRARAGRRRARLTAVTGAAVAVLAVGATVGIVLGTRGGGSGTTAAAPRAASPTSAVSPALSGPRTADGGPALNGASDAAGSATGSDTTPGSGAGCPATFGSTVTGGVATKAPLLPHSAQAVLVCAYGSTGLGDTVRPASTVLVGSDAEALITGLDASPDAPVPGACPMYRVGDDHRLTFVPIIGGAAGSPVSTTLGNASCAVIVRGVGSTHYGWSPSAHLQSILFAMAPTR